VAAAAGAFCPVEVLLSIFFDRLRTLVPFLRWLFGITIILSVMVCSYGVEVLRGSGPVPVMTPALPLPRPLPAVLPVVPVPLICPFASLQMKDPAQTPTKMICESLDKFIVVSVEQSALRQRRALPAFLLSVVTPYTRGLFSWTRLILRHVRARRAAKASSWQEFVIWR
jgi:hypothetical protein